MPDRACNSAPKSAYAGIVRRAALVLLTGALGVGAPASADVAPTSLTVSYRDQGADTPRPTVWTLRCNPARGTLPRPGAACRRLTAGGARLFAPVSRTVACTEVYGGPQTALVAGTVAGRRVWARFSRVDGCQIARWSRISPWLLPAGGVGR